jgi:hypothetical protein
MIKLIDILKEVAHELIGPFYHETDKENVESILKNGIKPSNSGYTYDAVSLSPAAPSEMYGDTVLQVYLTPDQFKRAVRDTYHTMEGIGMHLVDKRDIELAEKLIDRNINNEEYQELINRALNNEGFFSGEILVRETIPGNQIQSGISEATKGLWYYINRKKKLGLKSSPKNSKAYKAAVKAGEELSNEGIHDPVEPGILKKRLGKLSCTRVKAEKAKLKDKGTHYAKALQRYLNYHCND